MNITEPLADSNRVTASAEGPGSIRLRETFVSTFLHPIEKDVALSHIQAYYFIAGRIDRQRIKCDRGVSWLQFTSPFGL